MLALALITSALVGPPAPAPRLAPAVAVYMSGPVLDLALTEYGIAHGMSEANPNPLLRTRGGRVSYRLGVAAGVVYADRWLLRRGHRNVSRKLRIAWVVQNVAVVAWNAHKIAGHRRTGER